MDDSGLYRDTIIISLNEIKLICNMSRVFSGNRSSNNNKSINARS